MNGVFFSFSLTTFQLQGVNLAFEQYVHDTLHKNIISRYIHNGSPVFACFLDAYKAFDLVNRGILFTRLLERGISVHLVCSFCSGIRSSACESCGRIHFQTAFLFLTGFGKVVCSPQYCLPSILMICNLGVSCFWDSQFAVAFVLC